MTDVFAIFVAMGFIATNVWVAASPQALIAAITTAGGCRALWTRYLDDEWSQPIACAT